jgi:putative membrane protein
MKLVLRWLALAVAFWVATAIVPGITINGGLTTYLWVALLFGLINAILGSILKILTLPATIISFGLFLFIINAAMLALTARWSSKLDVHGFGSALLASLIISVVTGLLNRLYKKALPF